MTADYTDKLKKLFVQLEGVRRGERPAKSFETRSAPGSLVATCATLPSMSLLPIAPFRFPESGFRNFFQSLLGGFNAARDFAQRLDMFLGAFG